MEELVEKMTKALMMHATDLLDLTNSQVLILVETPSGERVWSANGRLRNEFDKEGRISNRSWGMKEVVVDSNLPISSLMDEQRSETPPAALPTPAAPSPAALPPSAALPPPAASPAKPSSAPNPIPSSSSTPFPRSAHEFLQQQQRQLAMPPSAQQRLQQQRQLQQQHGDQESHPLQRLDQRSEGGLQLREEAESLAAKRARLNQNGSAPLAIQASSANRVALGPTMSSSGPPPHPGPHPGPNAPMNPGSRPPPLGNQPPMSEPQRQPMFTDQRPPVNSRQQPISNQQQPMSSQQQPAPNQQQPMSSGPQFPLAFMTPRSAPQPPPGMSSAGPPPHPSLNAPMISGSRPPFLGGQPAIRPSAPPNISMQAQSVNQILANMPPASARSFPLGPASLQQQQPRHMQMPQQQMPQQQLRPQPPASGASAYDPSQPTEELPVTFPTPDAEKNYVAGELDKLNKAGKIRFSWLEIERAFVVIRRDASGRGDIVKRVAGHSDLLALKADLMA